MLAGSKHLTLVLTIGNNGAVPKLTPLNKFYATQQFGPVLSLPKGISTFFLTPENSYPFLKSICLEITTIMNSAINIYWVSTKCIERWIEGQGSCPS